MNTDEKKKLACDLEQEMGKSFEEISDFIFNHPELGGEEYESSAFLAEFMRKEGFEVQQPYGREKMCIRDRQFSPVQILYLKSDSLHFFSNQMCYSGDTFRIIQLTVDVYQFL